MNKLLHLSVKYTAMMAMCFSWFLASAQTSTVSGVVTSSADGSTIPGASILIEGTTTGVVSDLDGKYSIDASGDAVLVVSYIGYESQTVAVSNRAVVDIALAEDLVALDEVVVVGYGVVKKSDVTGSVSSVKTEELTAFPVLDAAQALQGRAAGVVVQSNNGGEPGAPISIRIRGNTSINASSAPLFVVDGFIGATMPQANDIASIEVLKDASATAIYGSRGANGVVLVTTKKGKEGKVSIELNAIYAVQNTTNKLDLLNAADFGLYQQTVFDNATATANVGKTGDDIIEVPTYSGGSANTDWQDLIYRGGSTENYQLSFSGGSDKINFYASGNYFGQKGIVVNSGFERATFLSNIDAQVNDKLKLGLNLFGSRGVKNGIPTQSTGSVSVGNDDVVALAMRFSPDLGIYEEDGTYSVDERGDPLDNPYAVATQRVNETITNNFRTNFYANYEIFDGLSFKTTFGLSSINQTEGLFLPSTLKRTAGQKGGEATIENSIATTVLSENYLTYSKELGKGNLTLLAGYSYQKSSNEGFTAGATGFPTNSVSYNNLNAGSVYLQPTSVKNQSEIQSQFARANFDYDDKYLLTATIRRDGSSNFAANEKYAIFPSTALGWKISNESFLKDNTTVSNLKLRASWGVTGNQAINPYQSLATLNSVYSSVDAQTVSAVTLGRLSNPDLKWETSTQTNIGLDLGLLENKINLSLDYYNIDTKDLIMENTGVPLYYGYADASLANVGAINNRGFEVTLSADIISGEDFNWSTDLNWSSNKNKVVSLINGDDWFDSAAPSYFSVGDTYVLREGEAVGLFWGYEYAGIHQGGDLPVGTVGATATVLAGDPLFKDIDENESLSSGDQTTIGDPNPDFTYGITTIPS